MNIIQLLKEEMTQERLTTEAFLDLYSSNLAEYRPHEKSMKMQPLAAHIAEIFGWVGMMLETDELDFETTPYESPAANSPDELKALINEGFERSHRLLSAISEQDLEERWVLRNGDYVIADWNKYEAIRHALNQIVHHRAQLGVYYRLNDIPVPASYGPTADYQ